MALFTFPCAGNHYPRQFARDCFFVSRNIFRIGAVIGLAQRQVIFGKRNEFLCTPKVAVVEVRGSEAGKMTFASGWIRAGN